jgi:hypothetical protein
LWAFREPVASSFSIENASMSSRKTKTPKFLL